MLIKKSKRTHGYLLAAKEIKVCDRYRGADNEHVITSEDWPPHKMLKMILPLLVHSKKKNLLLGQVTAIHGSKKFNFNKDQTPGQTLKLLKDVCQGEVQSLASQALLEAAFGYLRQSLQLLLNFFKSTNKDVIKQ